MPWYVKSGGTWKSAGNVHVPVDGNYVEVQNGYSVVSGQWEETFVKAVPTVTTLAASPTSVTKPSSITLTASVKNYYDTSAITTGTVEIQRSLNNGSSWTTVSPTGNALDSSGQYSYTAATSDLVASGTVLFRAVYSGVTPTLSSTSSNVPVSVTVSIATTTTVSASSSMLVNGSYSVTVTLAAAGSGVSGQSVSISDGSWTLSGTTNTSGVATFTYTPSSAGSKTLTGTFAGNSPYTSSSGTASTTVSLNPSTLTMSVSDTTPLFTQVVTLTATVGGAYPSGRTVTFQKSTDGTTFSTHATATTNAGGVATAPYTTSMENLTWRAVVSESTAASSATSSTTSTTWQRMPVTVTLTADRTNKSIITSADTTNFTAVVKDANGVTVTPTSVSFQRELYGVAFVGVHTDSASPFTYAATVTQSYGIQAVVSTWSGYAAGTSNEIIMYVKETDSFAASATRSYDASGALRYANSTDRIYHGYFDATNGDQRGAAWFSGFDWARINSALSITAGTLNITRGSSGGNSTNTTFYIGTHTDGSVSSTWAGIGGKTVRDQSTVLDWSQSVTITLNSTIRSAFLSGAKGITFGPANSTSLSYYGYLVGGSDPVLSLTYYTDPTL